MSKTSASETGKHTAGPWSISGPRERNYGDGVIFTEYLVHVGDKNPGNALSIVSLGGAGAISTRDEDVHANARLIAAAPDLLEACKAAVEVLTCNRFGVLAPRQSCGCFTCEAARKLQSAIAKATGE